MSWTLYELEDNAREILARQAAKSDWYDAFGALNLGETGDGILDLQDSWPLWREATEGQVEPLCYLFQGELRPEAVGAADPDVGFLGAAAVAGISVALEQSDAFFLGLLGETSFAQKNPTSNWRGELAILPELREFFRKAASRSKAVALLLD